MNKKLIIRLLIVLIASTETFASDIWGLRPDALNAPKRQPEGGVSDGGGGTTNPEPISEAKLDETVKESQIFIKAWFYAKGFREDNLIQKTSLQIKKNSACLTSSGKPSDASIATEKPGMICLSYYRIIPKLNEYNAKPELLALLVHEMMHLMGKDEASAVEFQKAALKDFTESDTGLFYSNLIKLIQEKPLDYKPPRLGNNFPNSLSYLKKIWETKDYDYNDFIEVASTFENIYELYISDFNDKLLAIPPYLNDIYLAQSMRLKILELYSCSIDAALPKLQSDQCKVYLDWAFKDEARSSASDIASRLKLYPRNEFPYAFKKLTIERVQNQEIFDIEFKKYLDYLEGIFEAVQNLVKSQFKIVYVD